MSFGWDPAKSERNVRKRGLSFAEAARLFEGNTIEFDDNRKDYGEQRIVAFGEVAGRVLVCVYTWRGTAEAPVRWIISLRKANCGESSAYHKAFSP